MTSGNYKKARQKQIEGWYNVAPRLYRRASGVGLMVGQERRGAVEEV
jgi:hypothetical protein